MLQTMPLGKWWKGGHVTQDGSTCSQYSQLDKIRLLHCAGAWQEAKKIVQAVPIGTQLIINRDLL